MGKRSPDATDMEVGRLIRFHRMNAGLSQTELGQKIGVSFQQVQKYEKGVDRVGAGRLTRIAEVLNVSVNTFFGKSVLDDVPDQKSVSVVQDLTVPGALRLVQAFGRIKNNELRRAVVAFVENIATEGRYTS
jgi:transcriptional regulator with XRE-family HTH domain